MLEERYQKALRRLLEDSASGTPVIVEGRHDEAALRRLGVEGPIVLIQGRRVFDVAQEIQASEVIVLTDFDPQGAKYARWLSYHLGKKGVKANVQFRPQLFGNSAANAVEELKPYTIKRRNRHGKNRYDNNKVRHPRKTGC